MIILTSHKPQATSPTARPEFDQFAESYSDNIDDTLSVGLKGNPHEYFNQYKIYYLRKIFNEQKKLTSSPLKILDYGCGVGLFSMTMFNAFPDIVIHGFDVSVESIKQVPQEIRTGSNIFTDSLKDLDSGYDIALLVTVLHHVVPVSERPGVMQNIYSRLKPGGKLIIIEHNMKNPLTRKIVTCKDNKVDADAVMLDVQECRDLLKGAGFRNITGQYIEFFPKQLAFMRFVDRFISWLPLGAQHMTSGTKYSAL